MAYDIIQGDCLDILPTIADQSIDLLLTDPPYGINFKSGWNAYFSTIANDETLFVDWLPEVYRVLKDGSAAYIFCHWRCWGELMKAAELAGFRTRNMIVIAKSNGGMGDLTGQYSPSHELVWFGTKGRHTLRGKRPRDVLQCPVLPTTPRRHHQNQKPVSWHEPFILASSAEGATILDPFCGSASCGVAAVSLNRNYVGIEMEARFCEISKERISGTTYPHGKAPQA